MSEFTALVDYADPLIRIERLTRELSELCLEKKYKEAHAKSSELAAEVRILQATLIIMGEKE